METLTGLTCPSQPQTYSLPSLNCEIYIVIIVIIQPVITDHKDALLDFLSRGNLAYSLLTAR